MCPFGIIWKFAIIGFLIAITLTLGKIESKVNNIKEILTVPDVELPQDGW